MSPLFLPLPSILHRFEPPISSPPLPPPLVSHLASRPDKHIICQVADELVRALLLGGEAARDE